MKFGAKKSLYWRESQKDKKYTISVWKNELKLQTVKWSCPTHGARIINWELKKKGLVQLSVKQNQLFLHCAVSDWRHTSMADSAHLFITANTFSFSTSHYTNWIFSASTNTWTKTKRKLPLVFITMASISLIFLMTSTWIDQRDTEAPLWGEWFTFKHDVCKLWIYSHPAWACKTWIHCHSEGKLQPIFVLG